MTDGDRDPEMVYEFFAGGAWCVVEGVVGDRVDILRITEDGVELLQDRVRAPAFRRRWNRTLRRATPVPGMRRAGAPAFTFREAETLEQRLAPSDVGRLVATLVGRIEVVLRGAPAADQLAALREVLRSREDSAAALLGVEQDAPAGANY